MRCARRRLGLALAAGTACLAIAQPVQNEPLRPLPLRSEADPARAALGKRLYFDVRLSGSGRHSCASCHDLNRGGADGRPLAVPIDGKGGAFNTPSIYNSVFNFRQSWIGRPVSLDRLPEHVDGGSWEAILGRLGADSALDAQFRDVYDEAISVAAARDALGHYLRSLVTPARFDRYLRGDNAALSDDEKAGYARFKSYGCVACHQGINAGGNMFARLGVLRPLPGATGLGRFQLTGQDADRAVYRVPSLRNVALTAPYFHDGSVASLEEAVDLMFTYQLGRSAPRQDKELIIRFLGSLSGERLPPPGAAP